MAEARWITEAEVVEACDLVGAIDTLGAAFALWGAGGATTMAKTHLAWGEGHTLHAIGAVAEGWSLAATKTWAHTGGGATPLLVLWDSGTGELLAVVEAFALGQLRTAGVSGLATRLLAPPGAREVAIVGSGRQALPQVAAVVAVRPVARVRVFSPTPAHRERLALDITTELGVEAEASPSVEAAVGGADIVITATRAREPFLSTSMLAPGAHITAIGAITPERAEIGRDVVTAATTIVADDPATAQRLARELVDGIGPPGPAWDRVRRLADVVDEPPDRSTGERGITLFKAMGVGLADLALGAAVLRTARERGLGRALPPPARAVPRLRP